MPLGVWFLVPSLCVDCFELSSCVIACDEICLTRRARLYRLPTSIYPISSCICHSHTCTHTYVCIHMGIALVFVFVLCTGASIFICAFTFHQLRLLLSLLLPLPSSSFSSSSPSPSASTSAFGSAKILFYLSGLFLCVNAKCEPFFPFFFQVLLTFRSRQQQQAGEWVGREGGKGIAFG